MSDISEKKFARLLREDVENMTLELEAESDIHALDGKSEYVEIVKFWTDNIKALFRKRVANKRKLLKAKAKRGKNVRTKRSRRNVDASL